MKGNRRQQWDRSGGCNAQLTTAPDVDCRIAMASNPPMSSPLPSSPWAGFNCEGCQYMEKKMFQTTNQ